jgi:CRP/FNR family transcriptional regulator
MAVLVSRCQTCAIRHKAVCEALTEQEIHKLNRIVHRKLVPAGQTILSESAGAEIFGNIISGVVKLTKSIADGRQHIVGLLFPPDFLGRAFREDNPYFAEAATDVELCVFPARAFEALLAEHPGLEHRLFKFTLSELDAAHEWMLLLARKSAEERVASFLLMIARRIPNIGCSAPSAPDGVRFMLPLARSDIADCLGLTLETVSRHFTKLKTRGVIELASAREVAVPDLKALEALANAGDAHV